MQRAPQPRVKKKDRTDLVISVALHLVVIAIVLYFVSKTELGQEIMRSITGTREKSKRPDKAPPAAKPLAKGALKPPPGAPPPAGGRRAVSAPAAASESFFGAERKETKEKPSSGRGTNVQVVAAPAPVKAAPPRFFASSGRKSDIKGLLAERAQAAASTEAVGSEQMSKAGASDAGAAVTKIAGATVVEGKYAVVRGLSDRYVSTTLNGANLPSPDPYRQSVPLDLFPAQVIDRIVATKTFTPDQEGIATGGGIDVITKSFPEAPFLSMSLGGEYNSQASFNDKFLTYDGGSLDWAGRDDGTRELPASVSTLAPIGQAFPDAPATSGVIGTPLYNASVSNATLVDKVAREMGVTQFAPKREAPPLNHSFNVAGGGSSYLFGRPLGYFSALSYKHNYSFYENGVSSRYQNGTELKSTYRDTRGVSVVNWSGMVNLAYQPFDDHELGFTFFYNQNATDDARIQDQGKDIYDSSSTFRKFNLYYIERNLTTYQMKGEHRLPDAGDLQFNWLVALTQTSQDEPDARFFNDVDTGGGYSTSRGTIPSPNKPTRYFRNLDEDNQNVKLDWTLPFRNWTEEEGKFKFGLFSSSSTRNFTERQFYYPNTHGGYQDDPNLYLTDESLGLVSVRTNFFRGQPRSLSFEWGDYVQVFDSLYNGQRDIQAGYLMLDLPVAEKLRVVGGVRYEDTDLSVHSESFLPSSITSLKTNDSRLEQSDLLPSVGLIYSVTSNMNVRLNYSQTIARPSLRELAAYYSYDPIISDYIEGNPTLSMTAIDNYDARWEWFPRPGELYSVSLFYKDLTGAIERGNIKVEGDVITFFNNDAKLYGIEFEARKNLDFLDWSLRYFSVGGNLSLSRSEVKLSDRDLAIKRQFFPNIDDTRPLYDQSPYVVNLDFNYNNPGAGTAASLIFNVAGPRIAITKLNTEDVYERPAPLLDFILSQKIGRNLSVKFTAKNLLNPDVERTYGKETDLLYSSFTRGRTYGLSLNYDF
jgi:outer membrane receptor protein involved in Fe transport